MRSTITLNGKNSSEIAGLLIQTLPPISKPLMRTQIEEIDGRDGDIVTKLGFSAYKKEFTIGLYGDYDVDQVIGYFNSEGTVTFSNEPDKYYYYQIIDQIDFEKLIRFKTATVTMHCQPFKYSTTETPAIFENVENLVSIPDFTKTTNGITVGVENGVISVRGTGSAATEFYIPITSLSLTVGDYVMRALGSGTSPEACSVRVIYNSPSAANSFGGTYAMLQNNTTVSIAATLSADKTYNYIYLYINPNVSLDFTLDLRITVTEGMVAGEGNIINMQETSLALFKKFDLKGDTSQQTYSGKNIFPLGTGSYTNHGFTMTYNEDGSITATGTADATYVNLTRGLVVNYEQGKTFTLSIKNPLSYTFGVILSGAGTTREDINITAGSTSKNKTLAQTHTTATLAVYGLTVGQSYSFTVYPMLEEGSTATAFEPYVGGIPAPNPDSPQDVQVVTGEQTVTVTGKNLLDSLHGFADRYINDSGAAVSGGGNNALFGYIAVKPEIAYTLSQKSDSLRLRNYGFAYYDASKTFLSRATYSFQTTQTITTPSNCRFIRIWVASSQTGVNQDIIEQSQLQLEQGSTATAYEAYQSQSYTINLGSIELCKIGDYQDYIYKSEDGWYVHKDIGKVVLNGSEADWSFSSGSAFPFRLAIANGDNFAPSQTVPPIVFTNYYAPFAWNTPAADRPNYGITTYIRTGEPTNVAVFRNIDITSLADWKTWLSTHNTALYYPLATPTDTKITDTALVGQLEALATEAYSYSGETNLISASSSLPAIMSVEAIREDKATIMNSGNTTAKPVLTIYGSGNIGVHLNGFQVFAVALGDEGYITIDTNLMEAYKDTQDNLKNRLVDGDFTNFVLPQGESQISFSGSVDRCVIENYSRWL